jgi:hypothetical protein
MALIDQRFPFVCARIITSSSECGCSLSVTRAHLCCLVDHLETQLATHATSASLLRCSLAHRLSIHRAMATVLPTTCLLYIRTQAHKHGHTHTHTHYAWPWPLQPVVEQGPEGPESLDKVEQLTRRTAAKLTAVHSRYTTPSDRPMSNPVVTHTHTHLHPRVPHLHSTQAEGHDAVTAR